MNTNYTKPSTSKDSIRLEGAFMQCSVRIESGFVVQNYIDEVGADDNPFDVSSTWNY